MIRKLPGQHKWRIYSLKTGRNMGTYNSKSGAVEREKQILYFKSRRFSK